MKVIIKLLKKDPALEHTLHIWAFLRMFTHFEIVLFSSFGWAQEITNSFIVYFKIANNQEKIIIIFLIIK